MYSIVVVLALCIGSILAEPTDGPRNANGNRIWIIAIGHDWGAHEYFDDSGYIQGFSKELIAAVCQAGGMDCRTMWTPYNWCWDSEPGKHPFGGQGLSDGWIDACVGWYQTVDRIHVFDFSMPYLTLESSYLFVAPGNTLDTSDLSGKRIGFIQGWQADEKCLARQQSPSRQNYVLDTDQIVYVNGPEELVNAILSGDVDAGFNGYSGLAGYVDDGTLEFIVDTPAQCALAASSMMIRKDSGFAALWNVGFQKLQSSGKFSQLCQDARDRHDNKGTIACIGGA